MLLQLPDVQTFLAKKASNYFAKELNNTVSIDKLKVNFFNSVTLKNVYVSDQNEDTLLAVEELDATLGLFNYKKKSVHLSLSLEKPEFNLYQKAGEKSNNLDFIIDYFSTEDTTEINNEWLFNIDALTIHSGTFHYHDYNEEDSPRNMNYSHVNLLDLNLDATGVIIDDNGLYAKVNHLSAKEKKGFVLKDFSTEFTLRDTLLDFHNTTIQTAETNLKVNYSMVANSFADYSDFIDKVKMIAEFKNSDVQLNDVAFFAYPLNGLKDQLYLDGKVEGTIAKLKGRDINIKFNKETELYGDFDLRGLPDIEKTFIHLDVKQFHTTPNDLRQIPYPPFGQGNRLQIASDVDRLGNLFFNGKFTGFYNDFVAYGNFISDLGSVGMDISVVEKEDGQFHYKGKVSTAGFQFGKFFEIDQLGAASLNLEVDGKGLTKEDINAKAQGTINSIEFAKYKYKDIQLNAAFSNQTFDGMLSIKDDNIKLNFNGKIDASKKQMLSDFSIVVENANLAKLNLFNQKDSLTSLSLKGDFNLVGFNFDEIEGGLKIDSILYRDKDKNFKIDSFVMRAERINDLRHLSIRSSILTADMDGEFKLNELGNTAYNILALYFEDELPIYEENPQNFNFDIHFINIKPITAVFLPALSIDSNSRIKGDYNSHNQQLNATISGRKLSFHSLQLKKYQLNVTANSNEMSLDLNANSLSPSANLKIDSLQLNTKLTKGKMNASILWEGLNKRQDSGQISLVANLYQFDSLDVQFKEVGINILGKKWSVPNNNFIRINGNEIAIDSFMIHNEEQFFAVEGKVSKNPNDSLLLKINDLDLAYLSELLAKGEIEIKGVGNGEMEIKDVYNHLNLTSDIDIKDLEINHVKIGKAYFSSRWKTGEDVLLVDGRLGERTDNILAFKGKVFPFKEKESLDLKVDIDHFPITLLNPYIKEYLSDLEGSASGSFKIEGETNHPILNGELQLLNAGMTVNYLQTHYTVNDKVLIKPDFIGFNQMIVVDASGSKAIVNGTIRHNNYHDWNLDIGMQYKDFLALNTVSKDNDLYYGSAICSGTANFSGFEDKLIIDIDATAQKGTDFKIPLEDAAEVSNSDFLIFTNNKDEENPIEESIDLSGIQMNFDLKIENAAKVQIIFDEKIGDILKANGIGNLKLEINTLGNFNIYGQYVISKGDYLFTLKNILNKRFDLEKGSRISWDGDPYQASIDMKAIYKLRASLADIMPIDSTHGYKRRVAVELKLLMTGYLLRPEIAFDIALPTADEETKRRLESILYVNSKDVNQQEMNQQVFGLLIFNRFVPASTGRTADSEFSRGAPGINNGYEFLSNQMSNWLSQVSDQFDVGVNYRQGNDYYGDEFDFSLSTELFQNRLVLDGNFGYTSDAKYIESQERSNFIGEFSIEYKLSKDGRLRLKGFNRSTNNSLLETNSPYTQGVGLFYREEFDTYGELWRRYFSKDSEDKKTKTGQ